MSDQTRSELIDGDQVPAQGIVDHGGPDVGLHDSCDVDQGPVDWSHADAPMFVATEGSSTSSSARRSAYQLGEMSVDRSTPRRWRHHWPVATRCLI
jgi:hypothetical protein